MAKLNPKWRIFVREYLKDKNVSRSYRSAYGEIKGAAQAGHRLLKNVQIAAAIERGLAKQEAKLELSAEKVLGVLSEFAFMPLTQKEMKGSAAINKVRCTELLAKHFKLLTDVNQLQNPDGGPIVMLNVPVNGSEAASEAPPKAPEKKKS